MGHDIGPGSNDDPTSVPPNRSGFGRHRPGKRLRLAYLARPGDGRAWFTTDDYPLAKERIPHAAGGGATHRRGVDRCCSARREPRILPHRTGVSTALGRQVLKIFTPAASRLPSSHSNRRGDAGRRLPARFISAVRGDRSRGIRRGIPIGGGRSAEGARAFRSLIRFDHCNSRPIAVKSPA